jgi:uncharacterized protein
MPGCGSFGPISENKERQVIYMTVDEFESIRLIDLEGLRQEGCAERMNVARTTAQAIYNSARVKLAECLVNEKELRIGGGDYVICDGKSKDSGCGHCHRRCRDGENQCLNEPGD